MPTCKDSCYFDECDSKEMEECKYARFSCSLVYGTASIRSVSFRLRSEHSPSRIPAALINHSHSTNVSQFASLHSSVTTFCALTKMTMESLHDVLFAVQPQPHHKYLYVLFSVLYTPYRIIKSLLPRPGSPCSQKRFPL